MFYNHWGSYLSDLGEYIVFLLRNIWSRMKDEQFGTYLLNKVVHAYTSDKLCNPEIATSLPEHYNSFIEYTYVVDMDEHMFITNHKYVGLSEPMAFNDFCSNWIEVMYECTCDTTGMILPKPEPIHDPIIFDTSVEPMTSAEIKADTTISKVFEDDYEALLVPRFSNLFDAVIIDVEGTIPEKFEDRDIDLDISKLFTRSLDWYAKQHRLCSSEFNGKKIIDGMLVKHPDHISKGSAKQLTKDFYWMMRKSFVMLGADIDRDPRGHRSSVNKTLGQVGLCMHIASYF
jgi:hypothetical protein